MKNSHDDTETNTALAHLISLQSTFLPTQPVESMCPKHFNDIEHFTSGVKLCLIYVFWFLLQNVYDTDYGRHQLYSQQR